MATKDVNRALETSYRLTFHFYATCEQRKGVGPVSYNLGDHLFLGTPFAGGCNSSKQLWEQL